MRNPLSCAAFLAPDDRSLDSAALPSSRPRFTPRSSTLTWLLCAAAVVATACGGSGSEPKAPSSRAASDHRAISDPALASRESSVAPPAVRPGSDLSDQAVIAFRADFTAPALAAPWNVFGASSGNREVKGGETGLWLKIASAERSWDAVGARTAKVKVDGDFDLRARFREFSAKGNGSAKLIVVDASSPKGEAAYVERIQIDGKNLFKFGGDVGGTLDTWGFAPTDVTGGDLRLTRQAGMLHAYARPDERSPWSEFAPAQPVPKSMPRVLKFGVKLSAETKLSAQVRWVDLTMNGQVVATE